MADIAIDMDGTIVDFTTSSFEKVEELYGIKITKEDACKPKTAELVWERMTDEQRSKYKHKNELYGEICNKGFFLNLPPFDGAIEAVKKLAAKGHNIFFLTKPLNWDRSAPEKAEWLKKYFSDIEYKIIMVESMECKHLINTDIIIDDDPRALEGVIGIPICIAQPWNEKERDKFSIVVDNFVEAAKEVKYIVSRLNAWKELE